MSTAVMANMLYMKLFIYYIFILLIHIFIISRTAFAACPKGRYMQLESGSLVSGCVDLSTTPSCSILDMYSLMIY